MPLFAGVVLGVIDMKNPGIKKVWVMNIETNCEETFVMWYLEYKSAQIDSWTATIKVILRNKFIWQNIFRHIGLSLYLLLFLSFYVQIVYTY